MKGYILLICILIGPFVIYKAADIGFDIIKSIRNRYVILSLAVICTLTLAFGIYYTGATQNRLYLYENGAKSYIDKDWYNAHRVTKVSVEHGELKVITEAPTTVEEKQVIAGARWSLVYYSLIISVITVGIVFWVIRNYNRLNEPDNSTGNR